MNEIFSKFRKKIAFLIPLIVLSFLFFNFNALAEKPIIIVSSYSTNPIEIIPESKFDLEITLKNQGDLEAKNVFISLENISSDGSVSILEESSLKMIDKISKQTEKKIKYRLYSEGSISTKVLNLALKINFEDENNQIYLISQNIGILFTEKRKIEEKKVEEKKKEIIKKPIILIKKYQTEPKEILPGDKFKLILTLKNESEYSAENILTSLGNASESSSGDPQSSSIKDGISLVNSSNLKIIKKLLSQKEQTIFFELISNPKASNIFNLEIKNSFENEQKDPFSSSQTISLPILKKAQLKITTLNYPENIVKGEEFILSADVLNNNDFILKLISLELEGEDFEISKQGGIIASLDPAMEDNLEIKVKINEQGEKNGKIIIKFKNDLGKEEVLEKEIKIKVEPEKQAEPEAQPKEPEKKSFWQKISKFFKALIGLGAKES